MGDPHQMVVHNIREVISRISVGLNKDHIVQFHVFHCNFSINFIHKRCGALGRIVLADHIRDAGFQFFFHFFTAQIQAVFVIMADYHIS